MLDLILSNPCIFWLYFGGLLLIIEILGFGCYLLFSGIAAIIISIIVWLYHINWILQSLLFLILTIIISCIGYYYSNYIYKYKSKKIILNEYVKQLKGLIVTTIEPTKNGYGRVKIADSSWRIYSDLELNINTKVKIISINGNTLYVKPIKIKK